MKILITGMSGFIGGYLKDKWKNNHELYDLNCQLEEFEKVKQRLLDIQPDVIVHLAARTEVEKSFYEQTTFAQTNYVGTVNLVECAKELKNLKLFVFSSTMETYGALSISNIVKRQGYIDSPKRHAYHETTPQKPNAPYSVAKVGCELYLQYLGRSFNFPYTIVRQTNCYGRKDNDFFVVEQIITQMLKNPKEINLGYKTPYRNFLYIDDLIQLYDSILNNIDIAENQIFCTGPNNPIQIEQLVLLISNKLNWKGIINWDTKPHRPGEIYYLSSTAYNAKRKLNWEPKIELEEGLDRTIKIWKDKFTS